MRDSLGNPMVTLEYVMRHGKYGIYCIFNRENMCTVRDRKSSDGINNLGVNF